MKKYIYSLMLLIPMVFASCNDDDVTVVTSPSARGTMTDNMGNTYEWVRIGNLEWTTSNAKNVESMLNLQYVDWGELEDFFTDAEKEEIRSEYAPEHGYLVTYEEAMANVPDGWRLPSDEDWKALERELGMTDADNVGWRGDGVASRLMDKAGVEMALSLGGILRCFVDNSGDYSYKFDSQDEAGYYWSSTPVSHNAGEEQLAYFRKIVAGVGSVERRYTSANSFLSVRWCRNATN